MGMHTTNGAMSTEANGAADDVSDVEMLDTNEKTAYGFDRVELIRLLVQAADNLGYHDSARKLEQESGVLAMSHGMRKLRDCLLRGDWDAMGTVLDDESAFRSKESAAMVRFRLYEQKFLELLEDEQVEQALDCMRNQLRKWCTDKDRLHKLSVLFMCTSPEDLRTTARWEGKGLEARLKVLEDIRPHISSSVLLQENRLEHLLVQALKYQKRVSMYPFTELISDTLLEDLQFFKERVPKKTIRTLHGHDDQVWFLRFSHDGKYLASTSRDRTAIVWDMGFLHSGKKGSEMRFRLKGHDSAVMYLAWSPDDKRLLTLSSDKSIRIWNMDTGKCDKVYHKHTEEVNGLAWLPDNVHFISGGHGRQIFKWNSLTDECETIPAGLNQVVDLSITSDGRNLVMLSNDRKIVVYDLETNKRAFVIQETEDFYSLHISRDSNYLIVNLTKNENPEIHLWDFKHRRLIKKFRGYSQSRFFIRGCFGGYDDMYIVCGSENKKVYLWHRDSKRVLATLRGHTDCVNCAVWSPTDLSICASASDDTTIRLWGPNEAVEMCDEGPDDDDGDGDDDVQANGGELVVAVTP